jgi:hypothetical protein
VSSLNLFCVGKNIFEKKKGGKRKHRKSGYDFRPKGNGINNAVAGWHLCLCRSLLADSE